MAYDGILGGYDPLIGATGRAFMRGQQQGMTPEQMAQNGAISFADAIALKQMADRMRAAPPPQQMAPQPQPTVVDDLRMQVAQNAAQPMRQEGLAGLPGPTFNMASGGIVAFVGGGSTDYSKLSVNELDMLSRSKDRETALAASNEIERRRSSAPPTSKSVSSPFNQTPRDFREANWRGVPADSPNFRPVSSAGSPGLGFASDERLLRHIGPRLPEAGPTPTQAQQTPPQEESNAGLFAAMMNAAGPAGAIRAPRLNAEALFPEVALSDAEQAKIKAQYAQEAEASGLPSLLRSGAARTAEDIKAAKQDKRTDTLLAFSRAGFELAATAGPFGAAVGKVGSMFANQYAQINKEAKQELRALKKEEEAYNRSLAEFNLNQNEKTRAEVQRREGILRERQGNIANVVSKQAELDLRAAQANLQAGDSAKDRAFRLFAARIGDQAKASQLKTEYEQAVIKANAARAKGQADVANREAARAAELLKAIEDFNKASPQVIASRERTAASAANNAPLGSGMYDDGFGELIK